MSKIRLLITTIAVAGVISVLFGATSVFADGASEGGISTGGGGSGCQGGTVGSTYWDDCVGASWQFYELSDDAEGSITIKGSSDFPGMTIPADKVATCKAVGGFWHLGYESYITGSSASSNKMTGAQRRSVQLGALKDMSGRINFYYSSGAPTSSFNASGSGSASAVSYGTLEEVENSFQLMLQLELIEGNGDPNYHPYTSFIDPDTGQLTQGYWGSGSKLGMFCFGDGLDPGFASQSSVSTLGQSSTSAWDGTTYVYATTEASSASVNFWHSIKRTDDDPMEASTEWTVTGTAHTPIAPTKGTFHSTATIRQAEVDRDGNITVSIPNNGSVEICQTITYTPKTIGQTNSGSSKACAIISRGAAPAEADLCPTLFSGYNPTINFGTTMAISQVRNVSSPEDWKSQDDTLWSKPGDSVQFRHVLCPGAQATRMSTFDGAHGGHSPTANGPQELVFTGATNCSITADSPTSSYWFGDESSKCTAAAGDDTEQVRYSSSTSTSSDKYSCKVNSFPAYIASATSKGGGYQLPGFATERASCNSDNAPFLSSVVGKTIKQTMNYSGSITANVEVEDHSWTHKDCDSYTDNNGIKHEDCDTHTVRHSNPYYKGEITDDGSYSKYAQVKIPYNYITNPEADIKEPKPGVVYGGEDPEVTVTIDIDPRSDNPDVDDTYATITKPTSYEVVVFTVPPSVPDAPDHLQGNDSVAGDQGKRACSYYANPIGGADCQSVRREDNIFLNADGNLKGTTENVLSISMNVPDLEVGTKYCIAVGVFPSDSHNDRSNPDTNDAAMTDTGTYWNYSKADCVTIAKKPSTQFWGKAFIHVAVSKPALPRKTLTTTSPATTPTASSPAVPEQVQPMIVASAITPPTTVQKMVKTPANVASLALGPNTTPLL